MAIIAIQQEQNNTNFKLHENRETKAHFLAAKIIAFAALLEGMVGIANFKKTGISGAGKVAGSLKTLAHRVPVFLADLFGFVKFGRKYSWGIRPLIVASHSYLWNNKDGINSVYNGYSLPLTDTLMVPLQKPIHFIATPIENAVVHVAKEIIPSSIMSERTIRIATTHIKTQLINYFRALSVFLLATKVCKLNIQQPKPSLKAVYGLDNILWIGLTYGFYQILDYLKEETSKPAKTLCTPTECAHQAPALQKKSEAPKLSPTQKEVEAPALQKKSEAPKPSPTQKEVEAPKKPKTLTEKLQEKRAQQAAAAHN